MQLIVDAEETHKSDRTDGRLIKFFLDVIALYTFQRCSHARGANFEL